MADVEDHAVRREFINVFNDYLDAQRSNLDARDASSSESEVEDVSENDDDDGDFGAVGNADVRAPDPLAEPAAAGPAAAGPAAVPVAVAAATPADAASLRRAANCICERGSCIDIRPALRFLDEDNECQPRQRTVRSSPFGEDFDGD